MQYLSNSTTNMVLLHYSIFLTWRVTGETIWILAWLSELSTANHKYVHPCPQPPTLLNCVCIPPFFLINKHYHRLTDYQRVLAVSCSLIPGPPVHYRSFTMSITAKTASLHYKTTITALFTTALATNNDAKWQKGGKQMIKQFEFVFTFMHLADAFIQSILHCFQGIHLINFQGIKPNILPLLAPCRNNKRFDIYIFFLILYNPIKCTCVIYKVRTCQVNAQ